MAANGGGAAGAKVETSVLPVIGRRSGSCSFVLGRRRCGATAGIKQEDPTTVIAGFAG